jgi:hypothetical protein
MEHTDRPVLDYYKDDLNIMARHWEEHAEACQTVRRSDLGDEHENIALLNRQKVFEQCAKEVRSIATRIEESSRLIKQQIKNDKEPKKR